MIPRPQLNECAEFYHGYIREAPQGDILKILGQQLVETKNLLTPISAKQADYRYAHGKWSIKEVLAHLLDAERVFAFRAFWFARNALSALPSMEQDDFVKFGKFDQRTLPDLLAEYEHVRLSNIILFRSFDEEMLNRRGVASGCEFTVRSFPFIIAGHERHHLRVLRENYLPPIDSLTAI